MKIKDIWGRKRTSRKRDLSKEIAALEKIKAPRRMIVLEISGSGRQYTLLDTETGETCRQTLVFYSISDPPEVGDVIIFDKDLFQEGSYEKYYGPYGVPCHRQYENITSVDIIVVIKKDRTYTLHRYYG